MNINTSYNKNVKGSVPGQGEIGSCWFICNQLAKLDSSRDIASDSAASQISLESALKGVAQPLMEISPVTKLMSL